MTVSELHLSGGRKRRSAFPSEHYALLVKNPHQMPEREVLCWDGKTVYPSLPVGGILVPYSEKECWHFDNRYALEGYETRWDALCDIWKTVQESEQELSSLRK